MGLFHSPRLILDGMSMCLDVANTKSYPGTGTVWRDLVNGLVFNSVGTTPTPLTSVNGVPSFAFNGLGYWECGTNFSLVNFGGDCTLIMWIYFETMPTRRTIFEKAGNTYPSYQQEIALTMEVAGTPNYFSRYVATAPGYDTGSGWPLTANAWNMMAIKMSDGTSAAARTGFRSINGSAWAASYTSSTSTAVVPSGAIRVGGGYAGTMEVCKIGSVITYNKMLSDEEIAQNYQALRGRYGV